MADIVAGWSLPPRAPTSPPPRLAEPAYPPLLALWKRSFDAGRSASAWAFTALLKLRAARLLEGVLIAAADECVREEAGSGSGSGSSGMQIWKRLRDDLVRASCPNEFAYADVRFGIWASSMGASASTF